MKRALFLTIALALTMVCHATDYTYEFDWYTNTSSDIGKLKYKSPSGTTVNQPNTTIYLIYGGNTQGSSLVSSMRSTLFNAAANGTLNLNAGIGKEVVSGSGLTLASTVTTDADGMGPKKANAGHVNKFTSQGGQFAWFVAVAVVDDGANGKKLYVSSNTDTRALPTTTSIQWYKMIQDSWDANNFGTYTPYDPPPIPEPTSGLLVLLGVAGLALKRRRV